MVGRCSIISIHRMRSGRLRMSLFPRDSNPPVAGNRKDARFVMIADPASAEPMETTAHWHSRIRLGARARYPRSRETTVLTTENVYERLNRLFRDVLDDDGLSLRPETSARDVEGWDSMTNVQLMLSVEREFGVHLSAGQMQALRHVGDLVSVIVRSGA